MQIVHYGDLIKSVTSNAIIMHGCNMRGSMGAGIAKQIKETYPGAYEAYKLAYLRGEVQLGNVSFWHTSNDTKDMLFIFNAVTQKDYWKKGAPKDFVYVNYDAIELCFIKARRLSVKMNKPIHYPMIGAGLANGDWDKINKIICDTLDGIEHHLWIYR